MTDFTDIVREERHYCSHLFRLLCHDKESGGVNSGLAGFLQLAKANVKLDVSTVAHAEIITEVAAFRDYYKVHEDRSAFLANLYDEFLPIVVAQYDGRISDPIRPNEVERDKLHPKDFGGEVERLSGHREQDVLFYREFSALFNAKPDLLIICDGRMLWFEVKFWAAFDTKQLQRTNNIGSICSSSVFDPLFHSMPNDIFALGTQRHRHIRRTTNFIDWADVAELAEARLPLGEANYSTKALQKLLVIDECKSS